MKVILKREIEHQFNRPVNSPRDCNLLAVHIALKTGRKISSSTLRRFFGLLPSKTKLSRYNLDTLTLYCSNMDYTAFCMANSTKAVTETSSNIDNNNRIWQITNRTLNSIAKKSLSNIKSTLPREKINAKLNAFINSDLSICPIIAPGGYGKSIALSHWVNTLNSQEYSCLFCHSEIFHQLFTPERNRLIRSELELGETNRLIETFAENSAKSGQKLIIVIDALDELYAQSNKIQEIIEYLLIILQKEPNQIKIVISCRESIWASHIAFHSNSHLNSRFQLNDAQLIDNTLCNIPHLTTNEIRLILELNKVIEPNLNFLNCISKELHDMLRIPINLHFFITLYQKSLTTESITINRLNVELLKFLIFKSKWAEEKEDLVWKIIDEIENGNNGQYINKNLLKNSYSIHLKREANYYKAYKALILDDIIHEERVENKYGIYTSIIRFKNKNIYLYLLIFFLVRKNNGISFDLFLSISQSKKTTEQVNFLIANLFEMAYHKEDYKALERYCELPEPILGSMLVRNTVKICFRINNGIRNLLMQQYAASPKGQLYLIDQIIDTN